MVCEKCGKNTKAKSFTKNNGQKGQRCACTTKNSIRTKHPLLGSKTNTREWSCEPCPAGKKKRWTINSDGKSVAKCVDKSTGTHKPILCHLDGVYERPHYTISVIDYQSWTFEQYEEASKQYTYWISHCQNKDEYQKWVKEFEYISEHFHQYHIEYELSLSHISLSGT